MLHPDYDIPDDVKFEEIAEQFALDTDILQQGAIDQTEMETYEKIKQARMGVILVDFGDKEVMKMCVWNQYNGRGISEPDSRTIGEDFCKSSKRHYQHPMEALAEKEWFLGKGPVKDFDTVDELPMAKLDVKAMGKNKLIFCSGAHRVRAMQYYVEYLKRTEIKLKMIIEKLESILKANPNSGGRLKLLKTSQERLDVIQRRLETGMVWTVHVSIACTPCLCFSSLLMNVADARIRSRSEARRC